MSSVRLMIILCFLALLPSAPAPAQQMDTEAMMRWSSADVVSYHIVGVYQARTGVVGGSNWVGYADVTDRVVIDLKWKLSESKLVGTPSILNEKSVVKNIRNPEPKCLPPILKGEYEHCELLGIKDGLGGALELQVRTAYPAAEVAQACTGPYTSVPASIINETEDFVIPSPVIMAMPLSDSDDVRLSPDKKSMITKKDGWTWTFTPTLEPKK